MGTTARKIALLLITLTLAACQRSVPPVQFHAQGLPQKLSDWQVLVNDGSTLRLNSGVQPFDLNTPLFSDYAHKLRTVWLPPGSSARYDADKVFDFPVGTIISKTFYFPLPAGKAWDGKSVARTDPAESLLKAEQLDLGKVRLIETRLLVHRSEGWIALPYVWNENQTEATLMRIGALIPLELVAADGSHESADYQVPDQNQCASCHNTDNLARVLLPIGPKARHLNRDFDYAGGRENQLAHFSRLGLLSGAPEPTQAPHAAATYDKTAPLDARARAYLDINCGHCHSAKGPANTSGLSLDVATEPGIHFGFCKQPVAAGKGTGNRLYDIKPGDAAGSVLLYRMESDDPAVMMPELGRSVVHAEGVKLISEWIDAQKGDCSL